MERVYVTKGELDSLEKDIRIRRHVERYYLVRQYCYGVVIDCACGVGYGSYILQTNPDVRKVYGVDVDLEAIWFAKEEYTTDKTKFFSSGLSSFREGADVLVSIETIEHIPNPKHLVAMATECKVKDIILSFPTKKSTNFNKYHYYDFYGDDIIKLFKEFRLYNKISIGNEVDIFMMTKRHDIGMTSSRVLY